MGKNTNQKKAEAPRKTLRAGALALLTVLGVGVMAGMALFNANAKPNRDMQWYIREGAVQVAAPALANAEPTAQADADPSEAAVAARDAATGAPTDEPSEAPTDVPTEAPADAPTETPDEAADPAAGEAYAEMPVITPVPLPEPDDGTVMLTITAAGDCTFGGEIGARGRRNFIKCVEKFGYDYFFSNVRHLFRADDLTIINLEGPLTTLDKTDRDEKFIFKGDPDYVKILTGSSVEVCNLANNHALDYGKAGLKETAQVLDDYGVGYCGFTKAYDKVIKGVRVRVLGFKWWDYSAAEIAKAVKAAREGCDLLIVNMHWGDEHVTEQNARQTDYGHAIIDAGADLIIGTHPHVYQGIERYKGKYIVYSLGNFCFAGNADPKDKRCLIFQQTFSFNPGMGIAQANILDQGINVIPATVSSVRDVNDFRPTIMTAENGAALLKAVASRSVNFELDKVRWTRNNYMVTYGLIQPETLLDANGKPVATSAEAAGEMANAADEALPGPEAEPSGGADEADAT